MKKLNHIEMKNINGGTVKISLTCVTSVLAGFAAAGTMLGAIVGGLGIACGF